MIQKIKILSAFLLAALTLPSWAHDNNTPKDSIKTYRLTEDVVIIAPVKENKSLRELPTSVTELNKRVIQAYQVRSIKDLTGIVPNIFIPDYGSKLSSAIYIRGIGSRINTPSVGLYVDDIPFIDKSAFDFDFSDVERIDILRGPQSTLYGRNTMGGLIKIYSKSPFNYQGTDLKIGAATYGDYNVSLSHYHRLNNNFAFSTSGFLKRRGGFHKNTYLSDKVIDRGLTGGGKFRGIFIPTSNLKLDLNLNYEYSDEGGFPYGVYDKATDHFTKPASNKEGSYRRGLFNAGLNLSYQGSWFNFSAITGYQNLNDRMFIDQDFSPKDIFTIAQKQKLNTFSEEFIFKSKENSRWEWTTGMLGFIQNLRTDGPVWFHEDGINDLIKKGVDQGLSHGIGMINGMIPEVQPPGMPFPMKPSVNADFYISDKNLLVDGVFKTPIYSGAIYHQSTINDFLVEGLSLTAGLRLNYEKNKMTYDSGSLINYGLNLGAQIDGPRVPIKEYGPYNVPLTSNPKLEGKLNRSHVDFLPRFSTQYNFNPTNSIYATISRGYRSGGYNVQMFSDLVQSQMQNVMRADMMNGLMKEATKIYSSLEERDKEMVDNMIDKIPPHIKDMLQGGMPEPEAMDIEKSTVFKPEYTWSYELGSHLDLADGKFKADLAVFFQNTKNQQIAKFAESGLGRITVNAGKSRSYGAEANLRYHVNDILTLHTAYGFTHAEFTEYETNERINGKLESIDYKGKRVPFVPRHTLNSGFDLNFKMGKSAWLDRVLFNLTYSGVGKVYWTEMNDVSQKFYGTVNSRVSFIKGKAYMDLWGKNLLNKDYATFYFESMGTGFMQKGSPIQFGITLGCQF